MDINSLPLSTPAKVSGWGLFFGGGYQKSFNSNISDAFSLSFATQYKRHMLVFDATTNMQLGLRYLYKIENFKNK